MTKLSAAHLSAFVIALLFTANAFGADAKPNWLLDSPELQNHDNKSYSAGRFIMFPAKDHKFVIVKFELTAQNADAKATDELANVQKLSAADKKAVAELAFTGRCFDMSKLALLDATGGRHPALWNTDDTIPTDVVTLTGAVSTEGHDPAHWSKTKRSASKLNKETRERLIKSKTIEANHPDFRTSFSGLLEANQEVKVSFLFQLPDSVSRDGLQVVYGNEPPAPIGGFPVVADANKPDAKTKPDGTPEAKSQPVAGKTGGKAAGGIPNWSMEEIAINPYGGTSYTREQVTLSPVQGNSLVQVSFKLTPLVADPKAVDAYFRLWKSIDRGVFKKTEGVRLFELRHLVLVDTAGNRYGALWNADPNIRTTIYTAEITPNSRSERGTSHWKHTPSDVWVDAEQSFLTRTIRAANGLTSVEYVTSFSGILYAQRAAPLTFLFSVPTTTDFRNWKLEYDSESYLIGAPPAANSAPATTVQPAAP